MPVKLVRSILQSPISQSEMLARPMLEFVMSVDLRSTLPNLQPSTMLSVILVPSIEHFPLISAWYKLPRSMLVFGPVILV